MPSDSERLNWQETVRLRVAEAEAMLLVETLRSQISQLHHALHVATMGGKAYRTANGVPQEMPRKVARLVKATLRNAARAAEREGSEDADR